MIGKINFCGNQTISQKAAGGEVVQVKREDDPGQNKREGVGLRGRSERKIPKETYRDQKIIRR
jgi:hypothetical protein